MRPTRGTSQTLPPPGYYDDPSGRFPHRWWDGYRWTDHVRRDDAGNVSIDPLLTAPLPTGTATTPTPTSKWRTFLSCAWAALPLISFGALTWISFGYAAVRTRRWNYAVAAVGYLGAFIAFVAVVDATSRPDGSGSSGWAALPILIASVGATVHAFLVRRSVFATPFRPLSIKPTRPTPYPAQPEAVTRGEPEPVTTAAPEAEMPVAPAEPTDAPADTPSPAPTRSVPPTRIRRSGVPDEWRRKRWKPWHFVVLTPLFALLGAVIYTAMTDTTNVPDSTSSLSQPQFPTLSRVTYLLRGTAPGADITIQTGDGGTSQQSDVAVPLRHGRHLGLTFSMVPGAFAYISAQNTSDGGWIGCTILVDRQVVSSNASSGAYAIATCSATV